MTWIGVAAVLGALSVSAGAFGAHGLAGRVEPAQLDAWRTASQYALVHSVAIAALGIGQVGTGLAVRLPALLLVAGVILFSGSIFGLVLGGPRLLGPVTPIGGLCVIAGWLSMLTLLRH